MKKISKNPVPFHSVANFMEKNYISCLSSQPCLPASKQTKRFFGMHEINKKGFSFIELLTVITIIAIMTIATSIFMSSGLRAVETAAREVSSVVREAQNYALTGKNTGAEDGCTMYIFSWEELSTNYKIDGLGAGCKIHDYSLKNGAEFTNGGSFIFEVPFSFVEGDFSDDGSAEINLRKGRDCFHVKVFSSGIVSEEYYSCPI